ncbi:MAG: DUF3429 domain-containing protein [Pseudomonadota bacterium]
MGHAALKDAYVQAQFGKPAFRSKPSVRHQTNDNLGPQDGRGAGLEPISKETCDKELIGTQTGVPAVLLAYLAASPLIIAALVIVSGGIETLLPTLGTHAIAGFMALYGALMIAFFGGVRWGVAVMRPDGPSMGHLIGAALPLLAALPLFLPFSIAAKFVVIMGLMALLLIDDLRATRAGSGAPAWYLGVRLPLTVLIEIAYLVALAAMLGEV